MACGFWPCWRTPLGLETARPLRRELKDDYNSCDLGVNTATSEGWGLVSFEHAATAAAQIVPDHTACSELWHGSAEMLAPVMQLTNGRSLTEAQFVSPIGLAEALERLYRDRDYLFYKSHQAYANATKPEYLWANIARKWDAVLETTLGQ